MSRITFSLPDDLHRALREQAARRGTTIGELVVESLEACGIRASDDVRELVARARACSDLLDNGALELAVAETRGQRRA